MDLLKRDFALFDGLLSGGDGGGGGRVVVADTSFIETVVFSARAGIEMSPAVDDWIKSRRYENVFFLPEGGGGGEGYETSAVRMESHQTALLISREIQEAYRRHGYNLIAVPGGMSLEERCKFVEERIGKDGK